jgi:hypothetical protein
VSFSSAETRWAPMLEGYPKNSDDSPNMREKVLSTFKNKVRALRDSDSPSRLHKSPKNLNLFTRALAPPLL